ncbi:YadA family autotransporter adhesin [Pseudomonas sp. SWRI153]|uniref:YadA family autotransporter adhesin n=1 Tax=Pseudomonas khorasanensis TaxID=2745508 RepID=A0A923EZ95_9PSED|nr:YadA family autotransporter adhesin [Pseudomonas khorasanensis]MBV4484731.1 YadA family autotransporter adhesin [Pseudomonas khorasanensis]
MNRIYGVVRHQKAKFWGGVSGLFARRGKDTSSFVDQSAKDSFGFGGLVLVSMIAAPGAAFAAGYNDDYMQVTEGFYSKGPAKTSGANSVAIGAAATAGSLSTTSIGAASQAIGSNSTAVGTLAQAVNDDAVALGVGSKAEGSGATAVGARSKATGTRTIALGNYASASADSSVALGNFATATDANSVALGFKSSTSEAASISGVSIAGTQYQFAGASAAGVVSIGNDTTKRQLTNVAAGQLTASSTDAVNGSQLHATNQALESVSALATRSDLSLRDLSAKFSSGSVEMANHVAGLDGRVQAVEGGLANIVKGGGSESVAVGSDTVASASGSAAVGKQAKATGVDASAVGHGAVASGSRSVALGAGSTAVADNSIALGAGSVAGRANSASVGAAGAERQITHVAAGTAGTDAVNVTQMNKGLEDANALTGRVYNSLHRDIKQLDDDLSAGVAGAMAMAALPQPYTPGASMTSAGVGGYRGQSALAVGVSHISNNGRWVSKLQGNTNSQGEVGMSLGVGYQW